MMENVAVKVLIKLVLEKVYSLNTFIGVFNLRM